MGAGRPDDGAGALRPGRRAGTVGAVAALALLTLIGLVVPAASADDAPTPTTGVAPAPTTNAVVPPGPAAHWVSMSDASTPAHAAVAANGTTYLTSAAGF